MSSVKREIELPSVDIRPMHEFDIPVVVAIERAAYQFPWSEGIFRDCLRVGYVCRVVDVGGDTAGYGIMSAGAGEAHILNVCIREDYRCRGLGRQVLLFLLGTGPQHRNVRGLSGSQAFQYGGGAPLSFAGIRAGGRAPRILPGVGRARGCRGAAASPVAGSQVAAVRARRQSIIRAGRESRRGSRRFESGTGRRRSALPAGTPPTPSRSGGATRRVCRTTLPSGRRNRRAPA